MDTCEREKHSIQKREQTAHFALSVLLFIAWLVPAMIISHAPRHLPVLNSGWIVLFLLLLFLLIFIPGISILGPFMQKTQRQKQNWLNEYGLHILAPITRHPGKDTLVIGGGRNTSYNRYLNWQDPDTGQLYSFRVSTRYSSALRKLSEGDLYPVQFDPSDLSFFDVPH